jgi:hypothetical protein
MRTRQSISAALLALACVGFASAASAQGLTRAEVRQQLIEAEANGSQFVTDASYPEVSPVYQQQVAQMKQQNESYGATASGSSASGGPAVLPVHPTAPQACVGPADFCMPYFGS